MAKFSEVFSTTWKVVLSLFLIGLGVSVVFFGLAVGHSVLNVPYLFAAYIATWVIHGVYLGSLVRRFGRLRQQWKELGKGK